MAVTAATTIKGLQLPNGYHRIDRIFGGKDEGWTALVSVHADETKGGALEQYNVSAPYEAGVSPYESLYGVIREKTGGADY